MRLVKGNSDKVYEFDLCDVGNDKYVVILMECSVN